MNCLRGATWLIAMLTFAAPIAAQSKRTNDASQPDWSKVRKVIQEQMAANTTSSIAVAVVRDGKILWEEGFGWADRENRIPANEHTMYYTASITKTFTETAILLLQERKQLDLDRPVNDYLGAAKLSSPAWNPAEATVRRVATHTAGLTTFNAPRPLSMDEMISRYGILFFPPGEGFDYSNLGGIILQEVVARVSGQSYEAFMRNEIFWPLGMTHASVGIGRGLEHYEAKRYDIREGLQLQPTATGGAYCSAHDLALFGLFHLKAHLPEQKTILSDASIDIMQNSTVATPTGKYGFAWTIEENRFGFRSVLAQGGTSAAQAWLRLIPSEKIAVVALANTGNAPTAQIVDEILSTLLPIYGEQRAEATSRSQPPRVEEPPSIQTFVGQWAGIIKTYRGDIPLTFSVQRSGDVYAKLGSQLSTLLNNVRLRPQRLSGRMAGDLSVEDAGTTPYTLQFYLSLRNGALQGHLETSSGLPFWVELKKVAEPINGNKQ